MKYSSSYAVPMYSKDTAEETQDKMQYALRHAWANLGSKATVKGYYLVRISDWTETRTHNGLYAHTEYIVCVELKERP